MKNLKYLLALSLLTLFVSCKDDSTGPKGPDCEEGVLTESCLEGSWYFNQEVQGLFPQAGGSLLADKYVVEFISAKNDTDLDTLNYYLLDAAGSELEVHYGLYSIPETQAGKMLNVIWEIGNRENFPAGDDVSATVLGENVLVFNGGQCSECTIRRIGGAGITFDDVFIRDGVSAADAKAELETPAAE